MANKPPGPLGENDLKEMKDALEQLEEAEQMADRAIRAGIDIGENKKRIGEIRGQLTRIRTQFFPGR